MDKQRRKLHCRSMCRVYTWTAAVAGISGVAGIGFAFGEQNWRALVWSALLLVLALPWSMTAATFRNEARSYERPPPPPAAIP